MQGERCAVPLWRSARGVSARNRQGRSHLWDICGLLSLEERKGEPPPGEKTRRAEARKKRKSMKVQQRRSGDTGGEWWDGKEGTALWEKSCIEISGGKNPHLFWKRKT